MARPCQWLRLWQGPVRLGLLGQELCGLEVRGSFPFCLLSWGAGLRPQAPPAPPACGCLGTPAGCASPLCLWPVASQTAPGASEPPLSSRPRCTGKTHAHSPCPASRDEVFCDGTSQASAAIAFGAVGVGTALLWVPSQPWGAGTTPALLGRCKALPWTLLPRGREDNAQSVSRSPGPSSCWYVALPLPLPGGGTGGRGRACPGQGTGSAVGR